MAVPPSLRLMLATSDDEDEDEEDDVRQGATSAKDGGKGNRSSRVSGSGAAVGTGKHCAVEGYRFPAITLALLWVPNTLCSLHPLRSV
jgi:hypothetical protein